LKGRGFTAPALLTDIFVPQICIVANKLLHHLNAGGILHDCETDPMLAEYVFRTHEILILSDDHAGDSVQKSGSGTHHARAQRAHQDRLRPVAAAASITDADDLGMGRRIAALYSQVVASGYDVSLGVGEYRSDREPTLS